MSTQRGHTTYCMNSRDWETASTAVSLPGKRPLRLHVEPHGNGGLNFYRLIVQQIRLVPPLLYRLQSCLLQDWMPADRAEVFDSACLTDSSLQNHVTLNVRNSRHLGVNGL